MLTNKEAAKILSNLVTLATHIQIPRGSAKYMFQMHLIEALCKAISILENTPDSNH